MENKELLEYRTHLIHRIQSLAQEFSDACLAVRDPFKPIEENGWNVHQVVAHTRDVQIHVYGMRARRSVTEDKPVFANFDNDTWNADHYHTDEPIAKIVEEFQNDIRDIVPWLESLPPSAWSRLSSHELHGEFTMQTWVERVLAHIDEHLETVQKAG
jgi:DinB superfamily